MASEPDPGTDKLFLALTQPAKWFGVPAEGFLANTLSFFLVGMWSSHPFTVWPSGVVCHFVMRELAAIDHNIFRVMLLWIQTKGAGAGMAMFGGSTLLPMPHRIKPKDGASSV